LRLARIGDQKVEIDRSLMKLVEQERSPHFERRVCLDKLQRDPAGDYQKLGFIARAPIEAHVITHLLSDLAVEKLGDARRHSPRGHLARLHEQYTALHHFIAK